MISCQFSFYLTKQRENVLWIKLKAEVASFQNLTEKKHFLWDSLKSDPVKVKGGPKSCLDNYVWQADLWPQHPVTPTAGWEVKLRKHSLLHLSVVFDLMLLSTMKSLRPRAKSHGCLLAKTLTVWMYVCVCAYVCVYIWEPKGSSVCAVPFFPFPTSQNATVHERTED